MSGTTFTKDGTANLGKTGKTLYLHVGPSGDCWTGDSIFAAKHLQPDYVKSIPLLTVNNSETDDDDIQQKIDNLLEVLEDDQELTANIYDTESIPSDLLERIFWRLFKKSTEEEGTIHHVILWSQGVKSGFDDVLT